MPPYHRAGPGGAHRPLLAFTQGAGETVRLLLEVVPFHRYGYPASSGAFASVEDDSHCAGRIVAGLALARRTLEVTWTG
ncbi:hypothetical protein [Deinococcus hopiensis]|uniref:hypothetical protein n=1 Tax=Deinococcus hopiensis TaxID=309885 RepID=UPI0009FDE10E|nr:hypothetical protein [Deinococcus hopiensis]